MFLASQPDAYVIGDDGEPTRGPVAPPWRYVLLKLAERWGCKPWELEDDAPADWIYQALEMYDIEAKAGKDQEEDG